jgi:hypothetical protein
MNSKQNLIKLGAERLAEELLRLSEHSQTAADRIKYITSTRKENLDRLEVQLDELCNGEFYDWRSVAGYTYQLSQLLSNLKESIDDSCEGVKHVRNFFERDSSMMEFCDDSGGTVGMIFSVDATDCFVHFARKCERKEFVAQQLLELVLDDQYGVRDQLIEHASEFLPGQWLRWLVGQLQQRDEEGDWNAIQRTILLQSLARQLKDTRLFEEVTLRRTLSFSSCLDIAQVYLESGDATGAKGWVERANLEFPSNHNFSSHDYQTIRREIYRQLGDKEGEERIAWEIFRSNRSVERLAELLQTLGEEQREEVITAETAQILAISQENLMGSDASFLLELGNIDAAEQYLMKRIALLNKIDYITLTDWVDQLAQNPLLTSLIYRELLNDILKRGYSKAYHYGVDYWIQLQQLSPQVSIWEPYLTHQQYQLLVRQEHGRKHSFWKRVSARGG